MRCLLVRLVELVLKLWKCTIVENSNTNCVQMTVESSLAVRQHRSRIPA